MNGAQTFSLQTLLQSNPGTGWGQVIAAGDTGCLPNGSIQDHSDRDVELAQGFGHFLTANDILKTSGKVPGSLRLLYDESLH